jgi:hypothetical protein
MSTEHLFITAALLNVSAICALAWLLVHGANVLSSEREKDVIAVNQAFDTLEDQTGENSQTVKLRQFTLSVIADLHGVTQRLLMWVVIAATALSCANINLFLAVLHKTQLELNMCEGITAHER